MVLNYTKKSQNDTKLRPLVIKSNNLRGLNLLDKGCYIHYFNGKMPLFQSNILCFWLLHHLHILQYYYSKILKQITKLLSE